MNEINYTQGMYRELMEFAMTNSTGELNLTYVKLMLGLSGLLEEEETDIMSPKKEVMKHTMD